MFTMTFEHRFRSIAALPVPKDLMGSCNGLFFLWKHVPHVDPLAPKDIPFTPQPGFQGELAARADGTSRDNA